MLPIQKTHLLCVSECVQFFFSSSCCTYVFLTNGHPHCLIQFTFPPGHFPFIFSNVDAPLRTRSTTLQIDMNMCAGWCKWRIPLSLSRSFLVSLAMKFAYSFIKRNYGESLTKCHCLAPQDEVLTQWWKWMAAHSPLFQMANGVVRNISIFPARSHSLNERYGSLVGRWSQFSICFFSNCRPFLFLLLKWE